MCFFLFQAEDGIRDLVRSRGLGDVYKRQPYGGSGLTLHLLDIVPGHSPAAALPDAFPADLRLSLIHI